jgi:hypothetical protein
MRKTDEQAKDAVDNLTKKQSQAVRARLPLIYFLFCANMCTGLRQEGSQKLDAHRASQES